MFLKEHKRGYKGILQQLYRMQGERAECERVEYLKQHLKFLKDKSARDLLMNLGMNRSTLAIDIRMQNIFKHLKVDFPDVKALAKKGVYDEIEQLIIKMVCIPLHIEPLVFDRILYQHYEKILRSDYYQLKLRFG